MSKPAYKKDFWLPFILWWLFCGILHFFLVRVGHFSYVVAGSDSIISNVVLALACYITFTTFRFYMPARGNYFSRIGYVLALSAICLFSIKIILQSLFAADTAYQLFLSQSLSFRFLFILLMITIMGISSWLFYYMNEESENKKRKEEAEQLLRDAELSRLRQQLQPHFLFNSLNSISALAGSKPEEARKMIQQLSDFLRGTLKQDDNQLVVLAAELEHLKLYLDIEKVRFGHRLTTQINADDKATQMTIPALLLQPLVENAIKFGLYNTLSNVTITINAVNNNGSLEVEISNPFDIDNPPHSKGTGFGLSSVTRRLWLLYGRSDLLTITKKGNIFSTTVKIPQS